MGLFWDFLEALGNFIPPYWLIFCIDHILNGFRTSHIWRLKHPGQENWAVVTGASDGIGEGFAQELAERGFNVILHGRNLEKLKKKEALIRQAYPSVKTRLWIADASKDLNFATLKPAIHGLHITLLVNNVGGIPPDMGSYNVLEDHTFDQIDRIMHMNANFTTKLEAALLPILSQNQPSGIINVSSLSSYGSPYVSVYAGTKGYLNAHSMSLQYEVWGEGKDIRVHSLLVGKCASNSFSAKPSFATPTSRRLAKASLDNFGLRNVVMTPYLPHLLQASVFWFLPQFVAYRFMHNAMATAMKEDLEEKAKMAKQS